MFDLALLFMAFFISFNPLLAVWVGFVRLPVSFSSFLFFVWGKSLNHSLLITFFKIVLVYTKLYRIFAV